MLALRLSGHLSRHEGWTVTFPVRIQLSRVKGFNLQAHSRATNGLDAVNVARPFRWGNPWRVGDQMFDCSLAEFRECLSPADAVAAFRQSIEWHPDAEWTPYEGSNLRCWGGFRPYHRNVKTAAVELRGKNLACWCPLGDNVHCHADVLLEVANQ